MANNTTWSFTGLPSGSSILSYSPEIPGVVFGLVNSDGVHTVLNARGTPTQAGSFNPTIRVGTNDCYKDVRVNLSVTPAAKPVPSCAVALANGTSRLNLVTSQDPATGTFTFHVYGNIDITPSEYATFSFSYVSGLEVPGLSMTAVPRSATYWNVEPRPWTLVVGALAGVNVPAGVHTAIWRVTMTSVATGCTATLDFPVDFAVQPYTPPRPGGVEGGS